MRIVFVVHTFFPNWRAGTEVYARSLAWKVIERGHEASIVCYEPPAKGDHFEGIRVYETVCDGLQVHRLSFWKKHSSFHLKDYFHPEVEEHLLDYLSAIRPDVVHVVHAMHLTTASIWAAKRLGFPVVATATDFWYICPTYQLVKWDESLCRGPHPFTCLACVTSDAASVPIRRLAARRGLARIISPLFTQLGAAGLVRRSWMPSLLWLEERRSWMKKTLAHVDVLVAPTANTARLITMSGMKSSEMRTSGFGLETPLKRTASTAARDGILRVGYVGTFRRSKGLHILLQAMRSMPAGKARLDIYGAAGQFPEYDRVVEDLAKGLENVSFRGTFPNEKLAEVFAQFDVLVIPSLWYENSPLVLLSAFALGTPVVASNVGSLADLVEHGTNGLLFEMGNSDDLAAQLRSLVDEPERLIGFRERMPAVRTINENMDELLDVYARLADRKPDQQVHVQRPLPFPRKARSWGRFHRLLPTHAIAQFSEHLVLIRFEVTVENGREIHFSLRWHARDLSSKWTVFIHLVDENGDIQIQGDHRMVDFDQDPWGYLTYRFSVYAAEQHVGKKFAVRVGVWNPELGTRLSVLRCRKRDIAECAVCLGAVQLK